jgi:adenylosuccinate synthase
MPTYAFEDLYQKLLEVAVNSARYIGDTSLFLSKAIASGKKVLFEGAQGAMLCLEHGTYPYVTSSSPLATAIPYNCGLPLSSVTSILGIVKAYDTRVGAGPFPSEIADLALAQSLRDKGHEYGTVTHRPRRIGWLDIPELLYVRRLTGVKEVALMLLDVLGGQKEIKVCTGYLLEWPALRRHALDRR